MIFNYFILDSISPQTKKNIYISNWKREKKKYREKDQKRKKEK